MMFKEEVFEITDFTTSSEWERFVSLLEEIIRQWDLSAKPSVHTLVKRGAFATGKWNESYETLKFGKTAFVVTHHYLSEDGNERVLRQFSDENDTNDLSGNSLPFACRDLMSIDNDFPAKAHCLVRWYGLRQFMVLSPAPNNENADAITSEDKAKLLLSSACIALHNTNCCVPIFVQMHHRMRRYYHGVSQSDGIRLHFDMIHFKDVPGPYRYVSELLNLFKYKLSSPFASNETPPVIMAIRFTHIIRDSLWPNGWSIECANDEVCDNIEESDYGESKSSDNESYNKLEWNYYDEPILEFQLSTSWHSVSEEIIVDSSVHTDLDPLNAPFWAIRVLFKNDIRLSLTDSIREFYSLKKSRHGKDQIMGKLISDAHTEDSEIELKQALSKLTNPSPLSVPLPQFGSMTKWNRQNWIKEQCMSRIFNVNNKYEHNSETNNESRYFKSAPIDSLTWRIAMTICNVYSIYKEIADIAHLWKEIISELRLNWEGSINLPLIQSDETPDMGMCLLHQKLQMINCCIEQKRKREMRQSESKSAKTNDESDDEFFDAPEEQYSDIGIVSTHAEGRLRQMNDLKLLNVNEPLYIPITQEPPPMTEDLLQEHSQILSQLGTSSESAALRARMQCASLLSDMESFKAANPGAVIEDFIRWHSPRDWIESEDTRGEVKGELSARMQTPGNTWREVWDSAKPIPAHRQKRLFDYTKEAEKVLHYLTALTVNDLIDLLMPIVVHCAVIQINEKRKEFNLENDEIPFAKDAVIIHCHNLAYDSIINLIRECEIKIHNFNSINRKFEIAHELEYGDQKERNANEMTKFILKLMSEPEMNLPKAAFGYYGRLVKRMFQESQITMYEANTSVGERDDSVSLIPKLPKPIAKEFIFRVSLPCPVAYSRSLPQRMYCLISSNEFRLCGAFAEDTCYF